MNSKVFSFFMLVLLTLSLVSCSNSDNTLTIGVTDDYPPMGYKNDSGELVGFEIDLAKAMAEEMDMELELVVCNREDMIRVLKDRSVDALISSVSMTKSNTEYLDFTNPYLTNGHVIVTRLDLENTIISIASLAGMSAGVETDSTVDIIATSFEDTMDFNLVRYETMSVCIAALKAGQLDCIICDMAVAIDICAKFPDQFSVSSAQLTNEPIAIALNLNNEKLKEDLNSALASLNKNGKLSEISIKHLNADYTQDIDTTIR